MTRFRSTAGYTKALPRPTWCLAWKIELAGNPLPVRKRTSDRFPQFPGTDPAPEDTDRLGRMSQALLDIRNQLNRTHPPAPSNQTGLDGVLHPDAIECLLRCLHTISGGA
jgi:hypothetical protein